MRLLFILFFVITTNSACANESSQLSKIIDDSLNDKSVPEHRAVLHKIIKWPNSCNKTFTYPTAGIVFLKIDSDTHLLQVTCTYGAYQGMSLFYKVNTSSTNSKLLTLPKSYTDKKGESEIWGNVLNDSTAKAFSILNLYSGFGNCGRLTTYDLSQQTPKIISLKRQEDCDKKPLERDPEKWPLIKQ